MAEYKPGVCNIGKNEIGKRYAFAVAGLSISAIITYLILLFNLPHLALLITFIPLAMAFEGLYQGYFKFCAGFATAGIYDFTGSGGSKSKVADLASRKKDMVMAGRIHLYSIISAIIIVAIIYFVL